MKTKVIFLFMQTKAGNPGKYYENWNPRKFKCGKEYNERFRNEGYFKMLERLVDMGVIDDLKIFYESNMWPGMADWLPEEKAFCAVVPNLDAVKKYIDKDTIIWVRGGFKSWHDWLLQYKNKNWLILYDANTGRKKWDFWDVILDDINLNLFLDSKERLTAPFTKPIDNNFWLPMRNKDSFDICVGASHIYDKKGQWRIQGVQENLSTDLKMILPGSFRRGTKTTPFFDYVHHNSNILKPGYVNKNQLRKYFNKSKIAVFLGQHGQNDRGPLEALACGCKVIIGSKKYHSKELKKMQEHVRFFDHPNDPIQIADEITRMIKEIDSESRIKTRKRISEDFKREIGIKIACERFANLILLMTGESPTIENKKNIVNVIRRIEENPYSHWG